MACLWAGGTTIAMPALVSPIARALATVDGAGSAVGLIALCLPASLAAGFVTPLALRLQLALGLPDIGRRVAAISVRFTAPVPLGATAVLTQGARLDRYVLFCGGVAAADGSFTLA